MALVPCTTGVVCADGSAMNMLLLKQYPSQNGLQDPLVLAEFHEYNSGTEDFVQVVNIDCRHWVCISNKFCSPGVVQIYDSMPHLTMSSAMVRHQVATILKTNFFVLEHVNVQRQIGSSDCALFAMAFATSLCTEQDPYSIGYTQSSMREDLIDCFERGILTPFPSRPKRLSGKRVIHYTVFIASVAKHGKKPLMREL